MQVIDLGKLRFNFAGDWVSATAYERNDVVKYGGNIYVYIYTLKEAARLPTNTVYWALMVKGIDFQGVYDVAVPYQIGDGVAHGGKVYVAIADSTGATPPDAAKWSQFVDGIQYEGEYAADATYQKNDIVSYGGSTFIAILDTAATLPTNTLFWSKFTDGISPQGVYNEATAYNPNDVVAYGGSVYYAVTETTANLPTNATFWTKFVDGIRNRGEWTTATAYIADDVVVYGGNTFLCLTTHAAGTFATDLIAIKWQKFNSGIRWRGAWAAATEYLTDDLVFSVASTYIAVADTISGGSMADDFAAGKFELLATGGLGMPLMGLSTADKYLSNDGLNSMWVPGTAVHAGSTLGLVSDTTVVSVFAATAPTAGQVLTATAADDAVWSTPTHNALTGLQGGGGDQFLHLPTVDASSAGKVLLNDGTDAAWGSAAGAYELITTATTAVVGGNYLVDTSGAAVTLTLPATPSVNDTVKVADAKGTFGTNNLTVAGNGALVLRDATLVVDVSNAGLTFMFNPTHKWVLV